MSRTVRCSKYGKDLPGLEAPPFPGPKGQAIFETVSKQAWDAWTKHQTMLINERHLNMMDPESRRYLAEQRDRFLAGDEVDAAEGYIPPKRED